ncbi:hypothetical protein [Moraxella sp.]|uniref:hypothetical protein n=1 Tax=Moraxella sp. TaxID=479 RepID=UPI0026DD2A70|nr:hypothetical protein [Moraxella sp.]MDO4895611.1 hypothetical protein [Moraxella sp.]
MIELFLGISILILMIVSAYLELKWGGEFWREVDDYPEISDDDWEEAKEFARSIQEKEDLNQS